MLSRENIDLIAQATFERYKRQRMHDGLRLEYEHYDDQPQTLKDSCVDQARDIDRKASLVGCSIVPAESAEESQVVRAFTVDEVEMLTKVEHERWVDERLADGWAYAAEKDTVAKLSPYLVPWEELSELMRSYDRRSVEDIIPLLASVGLVLVRDE